MPLIAGEERQRHDAEGQSRSASLSVSPALHLPKNKSTGNLSVTNDSSEKARLRFSFDAGPAAVEYDAMARLANVYYMVARELT